MAGRSERGGPRRGAARSGHAWLLALLVAPLGCEEVQDPQAPAADAWFVDVTAASGIDFRHRYAHEQRFWMPEISCGGLALFDFDGDGDLDLYCVQSGDPAVDAEREPNRLYRNDGGFRFVDVTEAAGVGDRGYGHGCATGDYDGDGDVDLYVANLHANVLYRNEGDGTFTDVTTEAGVGETKWSTACAFTDYDADGDLDLFVVNNLNWSPERELECKSAQFEHDYCSPKNYGLPSQDTLYRNEGDGRFTDVSEESGIHTADGIGLGLACADFDGDGRVDYYVANDSVPNNLWINQGNGRFEERGVLSGAAVNMQGLSEASMGIHAIDADEDGDWDLFMTHVRDETNTYYRNQGGVFTDVTTRAGLATRSVRFTGFGTGFHDFDHDGFLDLFVANGRVDLWRPFFSEGDPYAEPNQLFRGRGDGVFDEVEGGPTGGPALGTSRAAAFGDVDGDGDVDVAYLDWGEGVHLLSNEVRKRGSWIGLRLVGPSRSDALGAVVDVRAGGRTRHRIAQSSYSYCAANDPRVHLGLGGAGEVEEVRVHWPDGRIERFGPLEVGRYHELREGSGSD